MNNRPQYVRWDNHRNHLQTMFSHQFYQGRFCDVILACEDGQTIKAHRSVLCACSGYFDSVLNRIAGDKDTLVILKDCNIVEIKLLISFMYNGEISVDRNRLATLRKTAECLQVNGLVDALAQFIDDPTNNLGAVPMAELASSSLSSSPWKRRHSQLDSGPINLPNMVAMASGSSSISQVHPMKPQQVFLPQMPQMPQMPPMPPMHTVPIEMDGGQLWPLIPKEEIMDSPPTYDVDDFDDGEMEEEFNAISTLEGQDLMLSEFEKGNLLNVDPSERGDSKFIRLLLEHLYRDDLTVLLEKSMKGKIERTYTNKKTGATVSCKRKRPLTPTKVRAIQIALIERVKSLDVSDEEFQQRTSSRRFNQRMANSLNYVQRCLQDKDGKNEGNDRPLMDDVSFGENG